MHKTASNAGDDGVVMPTPMGFAHQLRQRRKERDLTQAVLAERAGCALDTLKKIEAGRLRPSHQLAELLAAALAIPPAERPAFVAAARATPVLAALPPAAVDAGLLGPPGAVPAAPLPTGAHTNLPFVPTPLVGRTADIAALRQLLWQAGVRLVTLTGPAGIGKTRLALAAGAALLDDCAHGVWFVPLAPIRDPAGVATAIASVLGVPETAGQPLAATLAGALRDKHLLLVLDNLEQVLAAGALISQLLAATARVKVLVTSREVLHLYGEHEYPVPPLRVPAAEVGGDPARLTEYAAVELFRQRAAAVSPGFTLTEDTGAAVGAICRRLDGLPLAIELAAARVKGLPPATILARLDDRLALLAGGPRDVPARQQTVRAAIGWSYDLLTAGEQQLFRRLAVFQGGHPVDAVEAVCNADGRLQVDPVDGVQLLLDKSLLQQRDGPAGAPRCLMLETIHAYAREQLEASGDAGVLQRAHARYFLAVAEAPEPDEAWLARLEAEADNLRAALDWASGQAGAGDEDAGELGLRMAGALWGWWRAKGLYTEGRGYLAQALACPTPPSTPPPPEAAGGAPGQAGRLAAPAVRRSRAKALNCAAAFAWMQGDLAAARALGEQSLALRRELGDRLGIAATLVGLMNVALDQGELPAARALMEESVGLRRELGDKRDIAWALQSLGSVTHLEGDYVAACALMEESLALSRELGHKRGMATALINLGHVALDREDYASARALCEESLGLSRELGDKRGIARALLGLSAAAVGGGQGARGAALLGAAAGLLESIGAVMGRYVGGLYEHIEASARTLLGHEAYERAWQEGRALSLDEAVALALAQEAAAG
ncbi:MAG TPA: tetratricopeptide repeat protein [Chloroflexia bacterium]|nr:tetratricopeptide repeat protein [Chloroflexia bacterium]